VPEEFVPKVGLKFNALEDAYEYYCDYAKLAGFDVRNGRKRPEVQWFFCNKEGFATIRVWRKKLKREA
jgi:hypothetical protein